jgi:hypothetical protein
MVEEMQTVCRQDRATQQTKRGIYKGNIKHGHRSKNQYKTPRAKSPQIPDPKSNASIGPRPPSPTDNGEASSMVINISARNLYEITQSEGYKCKSVQPVPLMINEEFFMIRKQILSEISDPRVTGMIYYDNIMMKDGLLRVLSAEGKIDMFTIRETRNGSAIICAEKRKHKRKSLANAVCTTSYDNLLQLEPQTLASFSQEQVKNMKTSRSTSILRSHVRHLFINIWRCVGTSQLISIRRRTRLFLVDNVAATPVTSTESWERSDKKEEELPAIAQNPNLPSNYMESIGPSGYSGVPRLCYTSQVSESSQEDYGDVATTDNRRLRILAKNIVRSLPFLTKLSREAEISHEDPIGSQFDRLARRNIVRNTSKVKDRKKRKKE